MSDTTQSDLSCGLLEPGHKGASARIRLDGSDSERFYRDCCAYVNHDISKAAMRYSLRCFKMEFGETPTFKAMQAFLLGGTHPYACVHDLPDGACSRHVETYHARRNRAIELLQSPGAGILSAEAPLHPGSRRMQEPQSLK